MLSTWTTDGGRGDDAIVYQVSVRNGYDENVWLSMPDLTRWIDTQTGTAIIECIFGVERLPRKIENILVRHLDGTFAVANPTLKAEGATGMLWNLSDGRHYALAKIDVAEWRVVGPKENISLGQALHRWSARERHALSKKVGRDSAFFTVVSGAFGGLMAASYMGSTTALIAGSAVALTSIPTAALLRRAEHRRSSIKSLKAIESSFAAPDALAPAPIETSLAKRFAAVTARRPVDYNDDIQTRLSALVMAGHHILINLDALDARTREEVNILLLDNLPQALDLHADIHAKAMTEDARITADERLNEHLTLIGAEVKSLVGAVDTALARQQEEFGNYLDAKLRRSELDS